jgi:hypothetical protein
MSPDKAFDIVDHAIIVRKLSMLSLPWSIINWIISILIDSKIQLKRGVILSQPKQMNGGIAQNSGIGPTLYTVHYTLYNVRCHWLIFY